MWDLSPEIKPGAPALGMQSLFLFTGPPGKSPVIQLDLIDFQGLFINPGLVIFSEFSPSPSLTFYLALNEVCVRVSVCNRSFKYLRVWVCEHSFYALEFRTCFFHL